MSYSKFTIYSGRDSAGKIITGARAGHWRAETIARAARRNGIVGQIEYTHHVADLSGRGRDGHDGRYIIDSSGTVARVAKWSEFGREYV